jgi:hypothetical protein
MVSHHAQKQNMNQLSVVGFQLSETTSAWANNLSASVNMQILTQHFTTPLNANAAVSEIRTPTL